MSEVKFNRSKEFYENIYRQLETGIEDGLTIGELCNTLGVHRDYFYDYIRRNGREALLINNITEQEYKKLVDLYQELKNRACNKTKNTTKRYSDDSEDLDKNTFGIIIKDENGVIDHYEYGVHDRHNNFITGEISRDLMNTIYSLYSKEGVNLTQRTVSRDILLELDIDFYVFKQILRVFRITKDSIPFAPHILDENSVDKVIDKTLQLKENLFFKKIEGDKIRRLEQRQIELLQENIDLKNKLINFNEWIQSIDFSEVEPMEIRIEGETNERALVVFLSDIHIGAMVNSDSLYENEYNPQEVIRRFDLVEDKISKLVNSFGTFDRIIVINAGDTLDGYKQTTVRGGHHLPQNLTDREQAEFFIKLMQKFIGNLWESDFANHIDYYAVADSNHDGVFGWLTNKVLEEYFKVKYPGMYTHVFNKFIDFINYGRHTLILTHGKDGEDMFKGYPLVIDDKTENKINEYIDYNFDSSVWHQNLIFCKGDLHQSATTYAKRFMYKSLPSMFGSSGWVQKNFGNTKPAVDMLVLGKEDRNDVFETRILLK